MQILEEIDHKTYYVVQSLHERVDVLVLGQPQTVPLNYMGGMVGVLPVFETLEAAQAEAGDKYRIQQVTATHIKDKQCKH